MTLCLGLHKLAVIIALFFLHAISWGITIKPGGQTQQIHYSYGGNFKAYIRVPNNKEGLLPVIIYNYDDYLDWVGESMAKERGYDIKTFIKVFSHWGAITIVPLERYRKLNAISGALNLIKQIPQADLTNIHVIGISEGALMSLLAPLTRYNVKTVSILAPQTLHETGALSFPEFMRGIDKLSARVFILVGTGDERWRLQSSKILHRALQERGKEVTVYQYPNKRHWFWSPENYYMNDIHRFIFGVDQPLYMEQPEF